MHRRDEIDATLAKLFAWTFAKPGDGAQVLERLRAMEQAAPAPPPDGKGDLASARPVSSDDAGLDPSRVKAQAGCRALAVAVADTWKVTDEQACLQATKRLLLRADRLGVELLEMHQWPVEAVRLLRLFVRWSPKMTRRQRQRSANVASLVPIDHPEAADLLIEIARSGDRTMADAFLADDEWEADLGGARGAGKADPVEVLAARLADVVDDGPTHTSRVIAVEFIERLKALSTAAGALRRALALPSFAVRARALHALATAQPCAVEAKDLVRVLRDLVTHAVPDSFSDEEHEENERVLADAILFALERLVPRRAASQATSNQDLDAAAEAFLDWIDAEYDAVWLDAGWATEALSIAFPEAGAAMVDYWLKCARTNDRAKALAALGRLPEDLARPRLQLASNDPAPSVRDPARQMWLRRFGGACPVDSSGLVAVEPAGGDSGDRFASRLLVMQGRVVEARQVMARALLAEAPNREALALLVQFIADDTVSSEPLPPREDHGGAAGGSAGEGGRKDKGWAALIAARFGAPGVEGLCALAARFSEPESFGWMRRLGDLVVGGAISREHAEPLRALAARHVASEDAGVTDDALRLLGLVGAPPELLDRALGLALNVDMPSSAARELILAWPDRTVDRRLASEMATAVAERNWARVQCVASVALGREAPAARVVAQRVLEVAEEDESAVDAAVECAHRLRASGALDDAWALAALARPSSPIFTVAARAWRRSSAVRSTLEATLASPARLGVSSAEAAIALLGAEPPMSPRDRRLPAVLAGAPPLVRAELVHAMCIHGAPFSVVAPHLEELLASSDPDVARALVGIAQWLGSSKGKGLLKAVLPRVVDAELRADIEGALGTVGAPYWVEG